MISLTMDIINGLLLVGVKPALALVAVIYLVSRTNYRGAAANHWILLCGLFSPFLLVAFFLLLPSWNIRLLPSTVAEFSDFTIISGLRGPMESPNFITLLILSCYLFGVFWVISYLVLGLISIAAKTRASQRLYDEEINSLIDDIAHRYRIKRSIALYVDDSIGSPLVWGFRQPVILLPVKFRHWSSERLHRILAHEMAHIARNDWLVKLLANVVCALFWFLPPVWMVARRIEWYAELACDDLLLTHYQCRAEYADDLLLLSSEFGNEHFALSFIRRSELYRRINAVLDGGRVREQPRRSSRLLMLVWTVILLMPLSAVHPVAKQPVGEDRIYYSLVVDSEPERQRHLRLIHAEPIETIPLRELKRYYLLRIEERITPEEVVVSGSRQPAFSSIDTHMPELPEFDPGNIPEPALSSVQVEGYLPVIMQTPDYPLRALRGNIEGRVIVQFDISDRGNVINPRIVLAQPEKVFDSAVLRAIRKFSFRPLRVNGKAIITKNVTETFVFKIEDATDKPKMKPKPTTTKFASN